MTFEPSNQELRVELLRLSHVIFGCIGMGGYLGPTSRHYRRLRMPCFPWDGYLLDMYGLPRSTVGWSHLLECFDLMPPTLSETWQASWRKREIERNGYHVRQQVHDRGDD